MHHLRVIARAIALIPACVSAAHPTQAVTISADAPRDPGSNLFVRLKGPIEAGDANRVRAVMAKRNALAPFVFLSSPGGDVPEAMEIGRLLRANEASVATADCLSSCVLVLVGAVERLFPGVGGSDRGVGLHRLYFTQLSPMASVQTVSAARQKMTAHSGLPARDEHIDPVA